ncbi:MAG: HU family DNA-binding protein [bacterium]
MNRKELVAEIANKAGIPHSQADKAISAFIGVVKDTVKTGGNVRLIGFGTFRLGKRAERTGINPRTKEKIQLKAANIPKFKAGKSFKKLVN